MTTRLRAITKDNQNSEDGEGTGEEQIEKGAEQDAGASGDFFSDMTESLGGNEQQKTHGRTEPLQGPGTGGKILAQDIKEKRLDSEQNAEDTDQDVDMTSQSSSEPEDLSEEEEAEPNNFAKMNLLQKTE